MRDHLLTVVTDDDFSQEMPGGNPTLGGLLIEIGDLQGVYTHSFEAFTLEGNHRQLPPPEQSMSPHCRPGWHPGTKP